MTKIERNKAIYECHKEGITQTVIGNIFSLSQGTVSQVIKFAKLGIFGPDEENRGATSKLTSAQFDELKTLLLKNPSDYGFHLWNKHSIKSLITSEFGVDYHENYIWHIMKCIGFSTQRAQLKDYRKNQQLVDDFKDKKAPEIKKSRG